jgi:hypothetical protein
MFFDCLDDDDDKSKKKSKKNQQQQQQQSAPPPPVTTTVTTKSNSFIDSLFDETEEEKQEQIRQQQELQQQNSSGGSKFAQAFAAMKDLKRQDKERIAIARIHNVNEAEADDVELKRKDKEMGVFRTRGYATSNFNQQQQIQPVEVINVASTSSMEVGDYYQRQQQFFSGVTDAAAQQNASSSSSSLASVETDEEKFDRLTKLVSDLKMERRKKRAMKEATAQELSDAFEFYKRAQAARLEEMKKY